MCGPQDFTVSYLGQVIVIVISRPRSLTIFYNIYIETFIDCLDNPPQIPDGATSDWDGSSKSPETIITYTCDIAGPVTRAVCEPKSKKWIPSTIPSC